MDNKKLIQTRRKITFMNKKMIELKSFIFGSSSRIRDLEKELLEAIDEFHVLEDNMIEIGIMLEQEYKYRNLR